MKKLLIKIASGVFALSLVFSAAFADFNGSAKISSATAATTKTDVSGTVTGYQDDVEWMLISDNADSGTISGDWQSSENIVSQQTPDVLKYTFTSRSALVTSEKFAPVVTGTGTNYSLVVEFDMMLNNVEGANFGFIYGSDGPLTVSAPTLDMQAGNSPCLSFYGVNSMFYSTLENDSLIYTGTGERPVENRWLAWSRSAKTTLYIHHDGSQELYQNDQLVAYVTARDIRRMGDAWGQSEAADDLATGAITSDQVSAVAQAYSDQFVARSQKLDGYMGFSYRPSEDSNGDVDESKTLDVTFKYLRIGYINETSYLNKRTYTQVADTSESTVSTEQYREQINLTTNPYPTNEYGIKAGASDASFNDIWWRIDDCVVPDSAVEGVAAGMGIKRTAPDSANYTYDANGKLVTQEVAGETWFVFENSIGEDISSTQVGWIKAKTGDLGYYTSGKSALVSSVTLPNADARLYDQRYAMLTMRTWLGGLGNGALRVTFGNYCVQIKQETLAVNGEQKTKYFLRIFNSPTCEEDTALLDNTTGLSYVPIKIYDNAQLLISLWGTNGVSVAYGVDGDLDEFSFGTIGDGQTYGNVKIETTSGNIRGFYDDIVLYQFEPYQGEDFTNGEYDTNRVQVNGTYATVDGTNGTVVFNTPSTSEYAMLLSSNTFTNFTLEFDSPSRTVGSTSWIGIVLGMDNTTDKYTNTDCLFMYLASNGEVYFANGTSVANTKISDGAGGTKERAPVIIPYDANEDGLWPTARPWHTKDTYNSNTYIGCADENIHFKLIVQDNVLMCYTQVGDYEMTKTFESIALGNDSLGNLASTGYVSIQSTSDASFQIDNVKVTENPSIGVRAVNTFLDSEGNLYAGTLSMMSASAAEADQIAATELLPISYPEHHETDAGWKFIGWVDQLTGYLISETTSLTNFGGRTFVPAYIKAYQNTLTTGGMIGMNFYVQLDEGAQKVTTGFHLSFSETLETGGDVISATELASWDNEKVLISDDGATCRFQYDQAAKEYRNKVCVKVRNSSSYFELADVWLDYSVAQYLSDLKVYASANNDATLGQLAVDMELYCEMAREYFDDSYVTPTNQDANGNAIADATAYAALTNLTSNDIASYEILPTAGSKPAGNYYSFPDGMLLNFHPVDFRVVFDEGLDLRFNFRFLDGEGNEAYAINENVEFYWGDVNSTTKATVVQRKELGQHNRVYFYVAKENIAAKDMATQYTLTVKFGEEYITFDMSVLGYAHLRIREWERAVDAGTATSEQEKAAWLCKALVSYNTSAKAYFG
ncbi:MAG: hypothetical protein IJY11_01315 [Clostridia bacterium]|nr:hypothetical protein [Clostridia bacterium]